MSKQISAKELAEIVNNLLLRPQEVGELDSMRQYSQFMTDIAVVVAEHCGGDVRNEASPLDEVWYVGVHGNTSLPSDGGIWQAYDKEGSLFEDLEEETEDEAY